MLCICAVPNFFAQAAQQLQNAPFLGISGRSACQIARHHFQQARTVGCGQGFDIIFLDCFQVICHTLSFRYASFFLQNVF